MIELNSKTRQDFLDRKWSQKLLDAGVDMSDAKYYIVRTSDPLNVNDYIVYGMPKLIDIQLYHAVIPTYTVSELMYKLHEWIYPTINGKEFSGGLRFFKDAPFYVFYYDLKTKDYNPTKFSHDQPEEWDESFTAECEYPIESLASLLIQCHQRDIGMKSKDVGSISGK